LEQPDFLNCVLKIATSLPPFELLNKLQKIEKQMGRKKNIKWGPRIIDLDILFYNKKVMHTKRLTIPHKELLNRKFVLQSLAEIAPAFVHPIIKKNMQLLYENYTE